MTDGQMARLRYFEARETVVAAAVRFVVCEGEWSRDALEEAVEDLNHAQVSMAEVLKRGD